MSIHTEKKALIVLSGGMDSVTLLYDYQERISRALSFDYGSKHNEKEIACAKLHCQRLGIEHTIIPLGFIGEHFRSSLLKGGGDIPKGDYDSENIKSTVVPFRNGIMLSIAAGLAESCQLNEIYIANHFGDHALYPDCRSAFVEPMFEAVKEGTTNGVKLQAPYTSISKGDIAKIGKKLQLDYSETWSCYEGGNAHCGECSTCRERIQAMEEAQIKDTTIYLMK